jgi:hypothetical protein
MVWGDDAVRFLSRVMAWPASDSDAGVVNLHWTKPNTKNPKALEFTPAHGDRGLWRRPALLLDQ